MQHPVSLTINGEPYTLLVEPYCSLLDMLRDQLQLTGTKKGCDEGDCGACTVLINGKTVTACMVLALDARDQDITTVEGLRQGNTLHPVQAAFVQYGGVQCGLCTPGMAVMAQWLARGGGRGQPLEKALEGNLCRCTGYLQLQQAIASVVGE